MYYKECGKEIIPGFAFCTRCGTKQMTQPMVIREAIPNQPPYVQAMKYCKECGVQLPVNAIFCNRCGYSAAVQKKKKKLLPIIAIGLTSLLAITLFIYWAVTSLFSPASAKASIGPDGGSLRLGDATISIAANTVADDADNMDITLTEFKSGVGLPAHAQTKAYILRSGSQGDEPVTVQLKLANGADTENLMMCLGIKDSSPDVQDAFYSFRYIDATVENGCLTATFVPADYVIAVEDDLSTNLVNGVAGGSPVRTIYRTLMYYEIVLTSDKTAYKADYSNGRFQLIVPTDKNGNPVISKNDAKAVLDYFERQYDYFKSIGYVYAKRAEDNAAHWPFKIQILDIAKDAGGYTDGTKGILGHEPEHGVIDLALYLFADGFTQKQDEIKDTITHEWFHFVQANYTTGGKRKTWFDDATATFFGSQAINKCSNSVNANWMCAYDGALPVSKVEAGAVTQKSNAFNASQGYGRAPLIDYLAAIYSKNAFDFILNVYTLTSGADAMAPDAALLKCSTEQQSFAPNYYQYLLSGCVFDASIKQTSVFSKNYDYKAWSAYLQINNDSPDAKSLGTKFLINAINQADIDDLNTGSSIPVGRSTFSSMIPSYGAKLMALNIEQSLSKDLPDSATLVLRPSSASVQIFLYILQTPNASTNSLKQVVRPDSDGVFRIPKFKEQLLNKQKYLLLVVSTSNDPVNIEVKAFVEATPTLDEIVGYYSDGVWTLLDVLIPQKILDTIQEQFKQGNSDSAFALQYIRNVVAQKGSSNPMPFNISKTGTDKGIVSIAGPNSGDTIDLPFTYKAGQLIIEKTNISPAMANEYTMYASYQNVTGILISGQVKSTLIDSQAYPKILCDPKNFSVLQSWTGSK